VSRRRNIRDDDSYAAYWITALVIGVIFIVVGTMTEDDPGAYLVVCPRGVDRNTMCYP